MCRASRTLWVGGHDRPRPPADVGAEFLLWSLEQEDAYELVDSAPVAKFRDDTELMAGEAAFD